MSLLWIFAFLLPERLFELHLSRRNLQSLTARGGKEFYPESFPRMVALHILFLLALFWESFPWTVVAGPFTWGMIAALVLLQGARYWCIISLGEYWNTRIVLVPGGTTRKTGPYRLTPHPNYLVVVLEFILLPLLMQAPYTLVVFFPLNLLILRDRIRLEEKALREFTDYDERFPRRQHHAGQS